MKADVATEHLDGGFEQDDGDGAIDVVVAVERMGHVQRWRVQTLNGRGHAEHEKGIVKMSRRGIEKSEGFGGRVDAPCDKQLGKHERQTRFAGQGSGLFGVRFGQEPALGRQGRG